MEWKRNLGLLRRACLVAAFVVLGPILAMMVVVAADGLLDELGKADVGVVLGNRVYADGRPSPSLQARLERAAELYHEGWFPEVVVSGGLGADGHDEAEVMRAYLVGKGVPSGRIHVDSSGDNTYRTAMNTSDLMRRRGWESAMVVTQYYHVPRSRMTLERFGVAPVYGAHARHFAVKDPYALLREAAALVAYRFRDYPPLGGASPVLAGGAGRGT